MSVVEKIHGGFIARRRARVLAAHLASVMPARASVLDVGCGDGEIAWLLNRQRPDLKITGVDVLVREGTHVPVEPFDGRTLPFAAGAFDVVSFIDVLHHCDCQLQLLAEARRVARQAIVIKDHSLDGLAARQTLRLMDWVGNHRFGVALPYNYWTPSQWTEAFEALQLPVHHHVNRLGLYGWPLGLAFDRRLHFISRLAVPNTADVDQSQELLAAVGIG